MVTSLCEITGSKKEVHHPPAEQRQSLPEDQDEQGVSSYKLQYNTYITLSSYFIFVLLLGNSIWKLLQYRWHILYDFYLYSPN